MKLTTVDKIRRYCLNVLISIDQLFNALMGGDPDETISSRFGKWLYLPKTTWKWKISYAVCRVLHVLDKNHREKSIEHDEGKHDILQ